MRKNILVAALLAAAFLPGCKKSDSNKPTTPVVTSINDIKVPAGFDWASSHNVAFSASITDTRFGTANHVISIYDGDPYNGGNLIAQGSATTNAPYKNTLYIAKQLTKVYVVKASPDNSKIINTLDVTGATANTTFADIDPNALGKRENGFKTTTVDCNSGCTNTITTNTSNLNVNSGDVICVTGSNITVGFSNVSGGTIRVCGSNVTLQNLNFNGAATLLITSTGSANVSGMNLNSSSAYVENNGTLNGVFALNGIFTNNGTYNCSGDFNINSSAGVFINNGTMNVSGNFNNSSSSSAATNNGTLNVSGTFTQNSGGPGFVNNCTMMVSGNFTLNNTVKNYALIKATGATTVNSGTQLGMYNGAMLQTAGCTLNSSIIGYGSTSLVKITGSVTVNSGAAFSGALQVASNNTISSSNFTNGAAAGNTLYIPTGPCNSIGYGTPAVVDADGDGVPDNLDAYPNDATKAYNNYYPTSSSMATAAFEDQWPSKGDYDLNDLVISYRYNIVTNAANAVVQVNGTYSLAATGGSLSNAFAIQFPTTAASVSGFTGDGSLEAGQSKAVVILFSNMRNEMAQWNTVAGATQTPAKSYAFSFNVTGGPSISTFGLSGYNPFIWSSGTATNRSEIHLWGHQPTDYANATLFGTGDDNTSVANGSYYLTKTGLPYAIEVPAAPFSYPIEGVDITKAYLNFGAWAQSAGNTLTDWYSNTATGYRNTANIYTR